MPSDKRILPALLLLWFLWFIGAHAFYAGKIEQGLFYILGFIILAICFNPDARTVECNAVLGGLVITWDFCNWRLHPSRYWRIPGW